ncbi:hypothetical protein [Falsiroseomonas ponticola]|uniref:hypothetical protein n=1 Tax=Falsiroseomonas ponticola TaxID=2786951 RepID=UPI0019329CA3|nr:hypothetical protein [Roseomonas ponticola]
MSLAAGGCAFALAPGWRQAWPLSRPATLACGLGALAWGFGSSGTHHLLYAAVDWQIRDAVLHDLATGPWPVLYAIGDLAWLLRAPLGYYMPAAAIGRLGGVEAAQLALFLWTALGLFLLLAQLAALGREALPGRRHAALVLALVFVSFGGLDLLPNLWLDGTQGDGIAAYWGRGGEWWAREFQFSGHVTLLLWVPNHALPAWLPALLLLRHARQPRFAAAAGLPLAAAAVWAPLSALGAGVLTAAAFLLAGWKLLRAALAGPPNWLSVAIVIPAGVFLMAGSSSIPHGFLFAIHGWDSLPRLLLFLLVEVGAVALAVRLLARSRLLAAAVALLAILPLYVFGPGNEMTMRGGIAALSFLAVAAALALAQAGPGWRRLVLAGLLAAGAAGQAMEASILFNEPWEASRGCTLPEAAAQSVFTDTDWSHYVVPWPDATLSRLLSEPAERRVDPETVARCWPEAD